jgi:hypothetical protein
LKHDGDGFSGRKKKAIFTSGNGRKPGEVFFISGRRNVPSSLGIRR